MSAPLVPQTDLPAVRPRFLSEADCHELAQRVIHFAEGGGDTTVWIVSTWRGNVRWARNLISTTGEDQNTHVTILRALNGAKGGVVELNETTDAALVAATRRSERLARLKPEVPESDLAQRDPPEPFTAPQLFFEATYHLDADHRAAVAQQLAQSATAAGMLSAGYIDVSATSLAQITSYGFARYFPYTWAQYSVTVRDPAGTGSGWAGVDWPDWAKIEGAKLSAVALDKCLASRHPVAVEPGRYLTILEPQAVCDFVGQLVRKEYFGTDNYEDIHAAFNKIPSSPTSPGFAKLGEQVVDERISIRADPMDPELGFPPFRPIWYAPPLPVLTAGELYHPATWIKQGVLQTLAYDRHYARSVFNRNTGLPNSGAFRLDVTGTTMSVDEMIASTQRGLLVTRFVEVLELDHHSALYRGYTRDGLWLIEDGKISKPVTNMVFTESILFALNNVEQLGVPQRAFHPPFTTWEDQKPQPVIVPAMKVRDFSFTALSEAV